MNWTDEQRQVIDARGTSILVSAAAGSGKTAVLVNRILGLIMDENDPADVDELLIVTFTNAAAGEMRERIGLEIAEARSRDPENEHLAEQTALLSHADITTIDGFCARVVRGYGLSIGIAPSFGIAEEGEMNSLRREIAKKIVDEAAEAEGEEKERFTEFSESMASGRDDRILEDLILRTYGMAITDPDPDAWLESCRDGKNIEACLLEYREGLRMQFDSVRHYARENLALASDENGPSSYMNAAESDLAFLETVQSDMDISELQKCLREWNPVTLSRAKPLPGENPALRERFRKNREALKKGISGIREEYALEDPSLSEKRRVESDRRLNVLVDLTKRFKEAFREEKERRNLMDFADLEHAALRILRDRQGKRTDSARELAAHYKEVMIDEYQDSNYLQEAILTAVSGIEDGKRNYFTVGDVKQSIYSFRQARPELFTDRSRFFTDHPEEGKRICLHRNFRSRPEVIRCVNAVFSRLMTSGIGGIDYDEDASLTAGAGYPHDSGFYTELMPVFTGERDESGDYLLEDKTAQAARELEARAIGQRILKMIGGEMLRDDQDGSLRKVRFGDIVILLRSVRGAGDEMAKVLTSMGVPACVESRTGYFDAKEVQVLLSFLELLDNPRQDLPLISVMQSPLGGFSAEETASITAAGRACQSGEGNGFFHEAVFAFAKQGEAGPLRDRLISFLQSIENLRREVSITPLHELVARILDETGYLVYVSALPGGAQMELNLRMLADQAAEYGRTGRSGLFKFVRYIRNLEKMDVDAGTRSILTGTENVVRIMSIHKSKGLEFPVVFAAGLGRAFNASDMRQALLVHPVLGLASDYVDLERRVKIPTVRKSAVKTRLLKDRTGEELRILYVAMTRAKQKLILCGTAKDMDALAAKDIMESGDATVPAGLILKGKCFFDWIWPAAWHILKYDPVCKAEPYLRLCEVNPSSLASGEILGRIRSESAAEELLAADDGLTVDPEAAEMIDRRFSWRYPYAGRENIPIEMSVSEIKRRVNEALHGEDELYHTAELFPDSDERDIPKPGFIRELEGKNEKEKTLSPAERGTAYHRVMELLDYDRVSSGADIKEQIRSFAEGGMMELCEAEAVSPERILEFVRSSLGERMGKAYRNGRLWREQAFVMSDPASSVSSEWPSEEDIYIQGIIDAFFEEDGEIVLVDYKTDRVTKPSELSGRYAVQADLYAEAIKRASGKPVKEKLLWSFALGEAVPV